MTGGKQKVLIVDDSAAVRSAVALMLRSGPYECLEAEDGAVALELLGSHPVDCIISDLHMPNVDGFEFLRRLRLDSKHKFTPVLILTTDRVDENRAELRRAGATGILSKPIKPDEISSAVERALSSRA